MSRFNHTKLLPYESQIRELRKAHVPYRVIAEKLKRDHGVEISFQAIQNFVRIRANPPTTYTLPDLTPPLPFIDVSLPPPTKALTTPKPFLSNDHELPPISPSKPKKQFVVGHKPKQNEGSKKLDLSFNDLTQ